MKKVTPPIKKTLIHFKLLLALFLTPALLQAQSWDTYSDTWVGTDGLGRTLPDNSQVGNPKANKTLAMFYYIWHEYHTDASYWGPWDISKILQANPNNPALGPVPMFHWWGEPWMGYYNNMDRFVISKHLQMMMDAGIDHIYFDNTNAAIYEGAVTGVFELLDELNAQGKKTPKVSFIVNTNPGATVQLLWNAFYAPGKFQQHWAYLNGKPLLMVDPNSVTQQQKDFFTMRYTWAWNDPNRLGEWTWIDHFPQTERKSPSGVVEEMSVTTAGHPVDNLGKSFLVGQGQPAPDQFQLNPLTPQGRYFDQQWSRALEASPPIVMVTQWNEWLAQRLTYGDQFGRPKMLGKTLTEGETFFVDLYNAEFNRDIEPSKSVNKDHYYYQLVANARKYKGVRPIPLSTVAKTIQINTNYAQWNEVGPEFRDDIADIRHRNTDGFTPAIHYTNTSGRNDIKVAKVARDNANVYFYASTVNTLSSTADGNWMMLMVDTDKNKNTGWEGYDFLINRSRNGNTCSVEKSNGGWNWTKVGDAPFAVSGNQLHIQVSKATFGLSNDNFSLDFKWVDNIPSNPDIMDFIDKGDIAPNGRFNYRFIAGQLVITQTPYPGPNPTPIPGIVEAENFDNGGEGVAYHDTTVPNLIGPFREGEGVDTEPCSEGGENVAFSDNGEWLEYTVNVATSGAYTMAARLSSPLTTGNFHIEMDGTNITGAVAVPNTGGWQTWQTVSKTVNLTAGQHVMRFVIDAKEFNTSKFTFTAQGNPPIQTPFPGPNATAIPGVVEAENFDNGVEGVAYHDTEEANLGGVLRTAGPDVFTTAENSAGLGWINNGEWMEYTVNAASAGSYTINARVASVFATGVFHLEWDGVNISNNIAVPNTGDWQTWQSVTKTVTLTAGQHVLRVFADAGNFNLNKITFSTGGGNNDPIPAGVYRLVNRQSGKVLDVNGCSLENGMKVQQWTWLGGNCQRWKIIATDNGYYKLTAQHSNQALEIGSALTTNSAKANQWPSNDCACQQWKIEPTDGGFFKLTARHSTQVLEVGSALMNDGAQVNQFPWNSAACQQWAIEPVPAFARLGEATSDVTAVLTLAPNPASEVVNVSWEGFTKEAVVLTVINMQGSQMTQQVVKGNQHALHTNAFSDGLYLVSVRANTGAILIKKLQVRH
ncbi:MAG: carbohydrate-binding protein [Bacteroidota bacterium]